MPSYAVITDRKKSDIKVARTMKFAPGTVLVMDRGYNDYDWFGGIDRPGCVRSVMAESVLVRWSGSHPPF